MFLRILKKDMARKKTMNIIIVIFVILASMFVASGLNNVITVIKGTDYFFDQAGIGDYVAVRKDDGVSTETFEDIIPNIKEIKSYRIEPTLYTTKETLYKEDNSELVLDNTIMVQPLSETKLVFFDKDNNPVKTVEEGHAYVSRKMFDENDFKVGDKFVIEAGDVKRTFIVDGGIKDALFGSDMISNVRILIHKTDYDAYKNSTHKNALKGGEFCYIDTDDVNAVDRQLASTPGMLLARERGTFKTAYIMNMIVAFITLILSVCLIIVAFVVLKFTITLTITEEYREIGVMKAIGIKNGKIRSLYLTKYLFIAIIGSLIGFGLSFPFGTLLLNSVSKAMVLGNGLGILPNVIGVAVVILTTLGFAWLSTGKVKKATPVDAIRNGQTGERFKKKSKLKLSKGRTDSTVFMACNDVLSSPKKYITVASVFALCAAFVLVMTNTVTTMKGDGLIDSFSARSEIYFSDQEKQMSMMHEGGDEELKEYLTKVETDLGNLGMPCHAFVDAQYIFPVTSKGQEYNISCQQGKNITTDKYVYLEGSYPRNANEVAITPIISEKIDAHIGDTITINYGTGPMDCTVTAYFQSMNLVGEVIRIHEDAPTSLKDCSSWMAFQLNFTDNPSQKEIKARKDRIKEYLGNGRDVQLAWEFQVDCLSVVPTMELVQKLLLGITLVVVVLVVVLMERSFISNEKSEIAILKAIGFKDRRIIFYHMLRFAIVTIVATIVAAAISIPLTHLTIAPIFQGMGMAKMTFNIDPLQIFLLYPAIILGVSLLTAFITSLVTKSIKSSDTASIE